MGSSPSKTLCAFCRAFKGQQHKERPPSPSKDVPELTPCRAPFPDGLGPLSVRQSGLTAKDVVALCSDDAKGGTARIGRAFFERSAALRSLATWLDRSGTWVYGDDTDECAGAQALELGLAPPQVVQLPQAVREAMGIGEQEGSICFAWAYPTLLGGGAGGPSTPMDSARGRQAPVDAGLAGDQVMDEHEKAGRSLAVARDAAPQMPSLLEETPSVPLSVHPAVSTDVAKSPDPTDVALAEVLAEGERVAGDAVSLPGEVPTEGLDALDVDAETADAAQAEPSPPGTASEAADASEGGKAEGVKAADPAYATQAEEASQAQSTASKPEGEERVVIDTSDPDVSFLTVGGYVYFRPAGERSGGQRAEPEFLSAHAIRFCPAQGGLQFAAPRRWEQAWTARFVQHGRFKQVTVRRWVAAGAKYMCWVRPDDPLLERGPERPLLKHGALVFLFHELEEADKDGRDRYYEVVGSLLPVPAKSKSDDDPVRTSSLPFHLSAMPSAHEDRLQRRLFALARSGKWPLVRHLLAEYPHFAVSVGQGGASLLHVCAQEDLVDADFLALLHSLGTAFDAKDDSGRTPEDLGSSAFRALAREVWGLSPDLFEDPSGWFEFWDRDGTGRLKPGDLGDALVSAYRCDTVGAQWVRSYVNAHHNGGVSRADVLHEEHGLLQYLRCSEEFAGLQRGRRPPLFNGRLAPLSEEARGRLRALEARLEQLRLARGWRPGRPTPAAALPLPLPAPRPEGGADPEARLSSARAILGFSFEQTRSLPGDAWQAGFRIDFAGQEGLDNGGLTKAWVSEIGFALWGDEALFDIHSGGSFFKPDSSESLMLDDCPVASADFYKWTGHFVAYALYQRCLLDCRLCAWVFRVIFRAAACREAPRKEGWSKNLPPDWPATPEGEDAMLSDMACLDHTVASNLWRVRHELSEEELRWLDFTYAGVELEPGGVERELTPETRGQYVRLVCDILLRQRCRAGLQSFVDGFFEVVPPHVLDGLPEEGLMRVLAGEAEMSDAQLDQLEQIVVPAGLVPASLREHPAVRRQAQWVFQAVRAGGAAFRARFLEFWIGTSRVPLAGVRTVLPRPRLQVMVQSDSHGGVKRIASWPSERMPEGHTCGNELWIALQDSFEQTLAQLQLAVENFEAGFALR